MREIVSSRHRGAPRNVQSSSGGPAAYAGRCAIDEPEDIRGAQAGDAEAFGRLVERHQAQVYRVCLAALADPHEAEDAAQGTFLKAYRALPGYRGEAALRTWLTRIAINQCRDRLRAKARAQERSESLEALLESGKPLPRALRLEPGDPPEALAEELLARLSPGERSLLELALSLEGAGYAELARRLGISVDSVKGRLKRARTRLRRWMAAGRNP